MQRKEGAFLQAPTLPSHFWLSILPFYFKCFLLAFSSSQAEEKKKIIKNVEEGESLPLSSHFAFSFLAPVSGLLFQHFRFKHFFLGIFFFSIKRKKKNTKKKNAKKGRSLPFFFRFCIWDEVLLLLFPLHIPSMLSSSPSSSLVSHVSLKFCAIQTWELFRVLEME
jgi:hypothetical protein